MIRIVIGVGHPDRGDDAVGPIVARRAGELLAAAGSGGSRVRIVERADPSDLPLLWEGADLAVLIDAVRSGRPAGTVTVHDLVAARELFARSGTSRGTHALTIGDAVGLGRILATLPTRVMLVAVEVDGVDAGAGLSAAVAAAVDGAVDQVIRALSRESRADSEAESSSAREGCSAP